MSAQGDARLRCGPRTDVLRGTRMAVVVGSLTVAIAHVGARLIVAGSRTTLGVIVKVVNPWKPARGETVAAPATEQGRRSRALIVDAAATLMYERGVRATSVDDVLAAAGAGKSQLYHYFQSKADLVSAVIQRQLDAVLAQQNALEHADSWAGIEAWTAQILAIQSAPGGPFPCPLGTLAAELLHEETHRPVLDAAFHRWEAPLARGLQAMKDRGDLIEAADPPRLATATIATLQGGYLLAQVHRDLGPLEGALSDAVIQLRRWSSETPAS